MQHWSVVVAAVIVRVGQIRRAASCTRVQSRWWVARTTRNGNRGQQTSGPFVYKVRRQLQLLDSEITNGQWGWLTDSPDDDAHGMNRAAIYGEGLAERR